MVAMNRMMPSWLIRWRSIIRSISIANNTMTMAVTMSASNTGTPRSIRPTKVSAANSTIAPWAKLKTPEALKMRTNPSATSEYMTPVNTPLITTSAKKTGLSAMSRNGATKRTLKISMA